MIQSSPPLNINPRSEGGLYLEIYFQTSISLVLTAGNSLARTIASRPSLKLLVESESFIYEKSHALASAMVRGQ